MRRRTFIPLLISAVLGLSGCKVGNMTSSHGQADQAYIYLASNRKYKDMVYGNKRSISLATSSSFDCALSGPFAKQCSNPTLSNTGSLYSLR